MEVILTNIQHDLGFRYAKVEARRTLVFLNVVSTFQLGIRWYYDAGKPRRATIAGRWSWPLAHRFVGLGRGGCGRAVDSNSHY